MKTKIFRRLPVMTGILGIILSSGSARAADLKTLPNHIPAAVARMNLQPIGNLAGTTRLRLAIGLPLHNQTALTNLLQQLYDPASPLYHHFLTPEQFAKMFGPSEQDYQAVMAFAKANGFTVAETYSNRMLVDVSGSVADIQKTFHVRMRLYHHPTENRDFYAPDVEPSVPSTLPVLDVSGLNDYYLPHPKMQLTPISEVKPLPNAGSGLDGLYIGNDFRNAYAPGVSLTGSGQTVGLLEFDGYYPNDITAYRSQAGLPNVPVTTIPVDGGVSTPGGGNGEVALDIDMVMAMAPGLSRIYVFEAPNPSPWVDLLNAMAANSSIKQFSCSWGGGPPNPAGQGTTADQIFQQMAAQGQSFFNASGDSDAFVGAIPFPSDDPYITEVGGTSLTMNGSGSSWALEAVWNEGTPNPNGGDWGSCGGISPTYPIPGWQQGINMTANQGSTTMRNTPDVAMVAANIYLIADNGSVFASGGTSAAAPLWAAFIALVNQQAANVGHSPVGFINPALYAIAKGPGYASAFHDITVGNNEWPGSPTRFTAVSGYDLCTGLGTPNGQSMIQALIGARLGILQTSVNPPTGSALLQSTTQPISVAVNDVYSITNATVVATVTNNLGAVVANLTFANSGLGNYSASLSVPAAANPLTMIVIATAPGEVPNTNVVNYSVIGAPPNDNFANATAVPASGGSYIENNQLATLETGEPKHNGDKNDAHSVWWVWKSTADTNVLINTIGSTVDNVLAVYTGGVLTNLQPVAGASSSLILYQPAQLSFNAQSGTSYYIAVAGASSSSKGTVALNIVPGGQPDTNAPNIFISYPQSGQTVSGSVLNVVGTASDTGPNSTGVNQVFVSDNGIPLTATGTTNWTALVAFKPGLNVINATAVDGSGNISAPASVQVNYLVQPPANDFFVNAIPLTGAAGTVSGNNTAASKEVGEPNPAGNPGGRSLWWSYTPTSDGILELSTSGSTFDTIMGLYTGTNVANLTTIVDNDDAYIGAPGGYSYISQAVRSGQTYYILVDGYNGASGTISLGYIFLPATVYHLTANSPGGGTVQLSATNSMGGLVTLPAASADFPGGASVVLTALPDHNDQFQSWSGGVNSPNNPFTITVNSDLTVAANFVARQFTDGFETGNLLHLPWATAGDAPWFVQTNVVDVGQYAARSGIITNSQSSSLLLTDTFTNGTGSFDFKVSSEPNFDILSFSVDGVVLAQWSGEVGWANYAFPLTAGTHTLEWTYAKDPTLSLGLDAAFLDDVDLPVGNGVAVATPAHLELQQQPGGGMTMTLAGQSGQQYIIQASTDMVHWHNISTNTAVGGFISIPLPANPTNQTQFYRAFAP